MPAKRKTMEKSKLQKSSNIMKKDTVMCCFKLFSTRQYLFADDGDKEQTQYPLERKSWKKQNLQTTKSLHCHYYLSLFHSSFLISVPIFVGKCIDFSFCNQLVTIEITEVLIAFHVILTPDDYMLEYSITHASRCCFHFAC